MRSKIQDAVYFVMKRRWAKLVMIFVLLATVLWSIAGFFQHSATEFGFWQCVFNFILGLFTAGLWWDTYQDEHRGRYFFIHTPMVVKEGEAVRKSILCYVVNCDRDEFLEKIKQSDLDNCTHHELISYWKHTWLSFKIFLRGL